MYRSLLLCSFPKTLGVKIMVRFLPKRLLATIWVVKFVHKEIYE